MKGYRYIALLLVMIIILGACSGKKSNEGFDINVSADLPKVTLSKNTSIEELLASMTLEEKVGQMVQGARDLLLPLDVKKYGLGSVLSGGGSYPGRNTLGDWQDMIKGYQDAALDTRTGIP